MRKLPAEKRAAILTCLCEGNSVNAACRMLTVAKNTVLRLLADAGQFCADYHDVFVRNLECKRVQADELWAFCGCKDRSIKQGASGYGSVWTWVAMDADTKLCISYLVGGRGTDAAVTFAKDIASRIEGRTQLTTDGHPPYPDAIEGAFHGNVDYAVLIKVFGRVTDSEARRYSPPECKGCRKEAVSGAPDFDHISTSYVERQNLTMRMQNRRMTRLTNAHSKKVENHAHSTALHYFFYNFIRKHMSLNTTPAVMAGLIDRPLTMLDLVRMIEEEEKTMKGRLTDYLPARGASK